MIKTLKVGDAYWRYDPSADVVHVSTDFSRDCYGEELEGFETFMILMRDMDTHAVCGLKILGAMQSGLYEIMRQADTGAREENTDGHELEQMDAVRD